MLKKLLSKLDFFIVFAHSKLTPKQFIFLSSVLVGISVAFAVIVLKTFAHSVFVFANYITTILHLSYVSSVLPIIGIVLTVFVVNKVLGGVIEKGTSQILYSVAKKASIIAPKQMYAQIITSSLTVGLGGSAGLESPIVITGAAFGSNYAVKYKLGYQDRTLLIGCGVAAGIAAAFNAPIAGVLFAIEVLLVDVSISAFTPIMIAAATGALTTAIVLDESILINFKQQQTFNFLNMPSYILLGIITGLFSVYYSRYFQRVEHYFEKLKLNPYKKAVFGASILSLLIFVFPTLFGEGYESIKVLCNNTSDILNNTLFDDYKNNNFVLLIFVGCTMLMKVFATSITLGSGGNGGNFAPSLFLGSYLGFLFSKVVNALGISNLPVANFTLVGMSGILAGLFHAPLTAIFLIAEITGGYDLMIPLMTVASISYAISKRFEKHSIDVKNLVKKGNVFTNNKDSNVLATLNIKDLIIRDYLVLAPTDNLQKLIDLISHSNQVVFAVVDADNIFVGIVYFDDVRDIIFNQYRAKYTIISDIMQPISISIQPSDMMEMVMNKFESSRKSFLPVSEYNTYIGFVSKAFALESYRTKLKSMTFE